MFFTYSNEIGKEQGRYEMRKMLIFLKKLVGKNNKNIKELPGPSTQDDDLDGLEQDQQVELDRHVLDVEEIVLELFPCFFKGPAVHELDLRPSGQSGLQRVSERVKRDHPLQLLHELRPFRPGSDEIQVAPDHVEQFGQFVDPVHPEYPAHAGYPRIVFFRPPGNVVYFRVVLHGSELVDSKDLPFLPHAGLRIDHRPGGIDLHQYRDKEKKRRKKQEDGSGDDRAEHTARKKDDLRLPESLVENEEGRREVVDRDPAGEFLEEAVPLHHLPAADAQVQHLLHGILPPALRDSGDDFRDSVLSDNLPDLLVIAQYLPDPLHVDAVPRRRAYETGKVEAMHLPFSDLLPDQAGYVSHADYQDVLPGRHSIDIVVKRDAPDEQGNGKENERQIIHPCLDTETGDHVGNDPDPDGHDTDCEHQGEEDLSPRLCQSQVV